MRFLHCIFICYLTIEIATTTMSSSESEMSTSTSPHSSSVEGEPFAPRCTYKKYGWTFREASSESFSDASNTNASQLMSCSDASDTNVPLDFQMSTNHSTISEGPSNSCEDYDSDSSSSSRSTSSSSSPSSISGSENSTVSGNVSDTSCLSSGSGSGSACDIRSELFRGSSKSTDEAVVALMDMFIKKRWKVDTLKEVLKFSHEFFPNNMPRSIYKLFSYVESHTPDYNEICHYYCQDCLTLKAGKQVQCHECDSYSTGIFFEMPLSVQIKHLFEQRNLANLIDTHRNHIPTGGSICDITSSEGYRELRTEVKGKYDLTLLFNTDGVSPVRSSEAHLYPILATISEIPPQLRGSFMLVCGVWYDNSFAPVMNDFFSPFVQSLRKIYDVGIRWTHPTSNELVKSVVTAPVMCADALCRADVLGMQHHNAKRGCNCCQQKSKRFQPADGGRKMRRYLFQEKPSEMRDQIRMNRQGQKAAESGLPVKGIVSEAVVSELPHFNRGTSAPPEYMHCVLLGVVKQFLKLWFSTPGDWNIKNRMTDVDNVLVNDVKVTDHFGRVPKKIKDLNLWKASDCRVWLLFLSIPALYGHLKEKYYQHWLLLVCAIYSLLKEKITGTDISVAEAQLRLFVRDVANLYRLNDYTYNVHNLLHLPMYVKRWGPLWATSAFVFESFNHVLGELAHGSKHKGQQIVNKIKLAHGLEVLRNKVCQGETSAAAGIPSVLGQPVKIDLDLATVDLQCNTDGYLRASVKGEVFTTQMYDAKVVRANSFVCFETGVSVAYGQVLYFYAKNGVVNCLVKKFKVDQRKIFAHSEGRFSVLHLIPVCETSTIMNIPATALISKHARVQSFLCIRPNTIEKNL